MSSKNVLGKTLLSIALLSIALLIPAVVQSQEACHPDVKVPGLLQVHPTNTRIFTDGTLDPATGACTAIVLSGSHHWSSIQRYNGESFSGGDSWYVNQVAGLGHNFTRGWHWEDDLYQPAPYRKNGVHYDLDLPLNPAYLAELRERVTAAESAGLYISIMLFQGWSVLGPGDPRDPEPWPRHPYKAGRNLEGIDGDVDNDGNGSEIHVVPHPDNVFDKQLAYAKAIVDELNEFDNVVWEITNESTSDSWQWQYDLIEGIRDHEMLTHGERAHLIWMSCSGGNGFLTDVNNTADIVSPCGSGGYTSAANANPPALRLQDLHHLHIFDSDHLAPRLAEPKFVWKSAMRGYHPIFMDLSYDLEWFPLPWDTSEQRWDDIKSSLAAVQKVLDNIDMGRMAPQARDSTYPSTSHFTLFSTADPANPMPDGFQVLTYSDVNPTRVCGLLAGAAYVRREFDELTGAARGTHNETADTFGCIDTHPGVGERLQLLSIENAVPLAFFTTDPPASGGELVIATGSTVTFRDAGSFDPDGGPIVDYRWDLDGDNLFDDGTGRTIQRTYNSAMEFDANLEVKDDELDTVTATPLSIRVLDPPAITVHPGSTSAVPGWTVTFTISATGSDLRFQWQLEGQDLSDGNGVTGARTSTLTLTGVDEDDVGFYRCVVSNDIDFDGVASQQAELKLILSSATFLRDTFTYVDGTPHDVDGRATEVGGGVWESNGELLVTNGDQLSVWAQAGAPVDGVGGVAFDPLALKLVARLEAEVKPDVAQFVSVGFTRDATTPFRLGTERNGQLVVRLRTSAANPFYVVRGAGEPAEIATGSIPNHVTGQASSVAIEYDPVQNTARVRINDTAIPLGTSQTTEPFELDFAPDIHYAGVNFNQAERTSTVDDFLVRAQPVQERDTFTYIDGMPHDVDGRATEVGGGVWESNGELLVTNADQLSVWAQAGAPVDGVGGVAFDPLALNLVSRLEAEVKPDVAQFVSVGFTRDATTPFRLGTERNGQLVVRLRTNVANPFYVVRGAGEPAGIATGSIPNHVTGQASSVAIEYDPVQSTARVWINDTAIPLGTSSTTEPFELDFAPDIHYAGVNFNQAERTSTVDDFLVRAQPVQERDTFTYIDGTSHDLDGRATEVGGGVWESNGELLVTNSDQLSVWAQSGAPVDGVGGVAFDPLALNLVSRLEAEVKPDVAQFISVGFSRDATTPFRLGTERNGQLVVRLRTNVANPFYVVRGAGEPAEIATGTIPNHVTGQASSVAIEYDPVLNTARVRINDTAIPLGTSQTTEPFELDFTPDIHYAGVNFNQAERTSTVDDFLVRVE